MILEVDAGNSRIKWRTWLDGQINARGVTAKDRLGQWLDSMDADVQPEKIRIACVGDQTVVSAVMEKADLWGCPCLVASTSKSVAGVQCGYLDASALGVDRWLALVAAYKQLGKACLVVDMGTAITLDIVNDQGVHQGGYIVPGLQMMKTSLFRGTHQVKVDGVGFDTLVPGRSTEEAVARGCLLMVKAMVMSAQEDTTISAPEAELLVTGGDGEKLMTHLSAEAIYAPDLVLDGLQYVVP